LRRTVGAIVASLLLSLAPWAEIQPVRLASWNVYNLFDDIDDPYADKVVSTDEMKRKLQGLSACLGKIQADVIGLQEVEKHSLAQQLARSAGYRYAILVEGNDTQRGIDVCLLSKIAVKGYRSHKDDRLPYVEGASRDGRFSRDCLEVHLDTSKPTALLVNHFKSKAGKGRGSDSKRRAQALRTVQIVREMEKKSPGLGIAVLGDLNDGLESWTLEPLARSSLQDPFAHMAPAQRYTIKHRGRGYAIDHILLNPTLKKSLMPGTARVGRDPDFRKQSDHSPVWVDLNL